MYRVKIALVEINAIGFILKPIGGVNMGNKFEVWSWVVVNPEIKDCNKYDYVNRYAGESFLDALIVMYKEKKKGVGCVKFYWR